MKTKKLVLALPVFLLLASCGAISLLTDEGARINDGALNAAEFTICQGASVGSIRRHYGSPDKSKIWAELCNSVDGFKPKTN